MELRGAFFEEGRCAFFLVFRRSAEPEIGCFEQQARALTGLHSLVCGLESQFNGDGGVGTDLLQDGFGTRDEVSR
jgi:hypothetical protein